MRRQQLTQLHARHDVCIFCRAWLTPKVPGWGARRVTKDLRRSINSSSSTSQNAIAAAIHRDDEPEGVPHGSAPVNTRPDRGWAGGAHLGHGLSAEKDRQRQATQTRVPFTGPFVAHQSGLPLSQALLAGKIAAAASRSTENAPLARQQQTRQALQRQPGQVKSSLDNGIGTLTPQEQRQRDALMTGADHLRSRIDRIKEEEPNRQAGEGVLWRYQHYRAKTSPVVQRPSQHPETEPSTPSFRIRFRQAQQTVEAPKTPTSNMTSSWKHLGFKKPSLSQPPSPDPGPHPAVKPSFERDPKTREYLEQRQEREQQTRQGQFVGLDSHNKSWCHNCHQHGHQAQHCPTKASLRDVVCAQCGARGHVKVDCPSMRPTGPVRPAINATVATTRRSSFSVTENQDIQILQRTSHAVADTEADAIIDTTNAHAKSEGRAEPGSSKRQTKRSEEQLNEISKVKRKKWDIEMDDDFLMMEAEREAERRKERKSERAKQNTMTSRTLTPVYLPEFITVANLATALRVRIDQFIHKMGTLGFDSVRGDHVLNAENAALIAMEYDYEPIIDRPEVEAEDDLKPRPEVEDKSLLPQRPPIVTIMGHVDHGKTTILDYLRKSSVAASEFGGITQHIGAFSVQLSSGRLITFLDTPGHAAFLSMRQRGANVTDIVVLVVAADDSVKPQTIEAIKHAQTAQVPIIVAINKIDKDEASPDRVKQDLALNGIQVEDFGGDTQAVLVSGRTGQGIEELEEAIVTLSEILDHRADVDGPVEGWILEASTKRAGRVATVLVRRGTLRPGDIIVAGTAWGRVRGLRNEAGAPVQSAAPGTAVEVDGWREPPAAGDEVLQAPDEHKATAVVRLREKKQDSKRLASDIEAINEARRELQEKRKLEQLAAADPINERFGHAKAAPASEAASSGPHKVPFVVKADVSGSAEAVLNAISGLGNGEVQPNVLRSGVGPISEFDIELAAVAKGNIISFNTNVDSGVSKMAEQAGVRILDHRIIYHLVDDVKACLSEHLTPTVTQRVTGEAEIAQTFSITVERRKQLLIAGCKVRNGLVTRGSKARVLRNKEVIHEGTISSLKNVKKDVTEMRKGTECGISFENWHAFEVGDQIQCYEEKTEKRAL